MWYLDEENKPHIHIFLGSSIEMERKYKETKELKIKLIIPNCAC